MPGNTPFDIEPIVDDLRSIQNYQRERCWEKVPHRDPQNGGHKMGENAGGDKRHLYLPIPQELKEHNFFN